MSLDIYLDENNDGENKKAILFDIKYGMFDFSKKALNLYSERSGSILCLDNIYDKFLRTDPILIQIVKELGDEASDSNSKIVIKYYPKEYIDNDCFDINYDDMGSESIKLHESALKTILKIIKEKDTEINKLKEEINRLMKL